MCVSLLFLGFLLLAVGANCMYASNSAVVDLRPNNFDNLVLNSDHVWVVEFYAPWCGYCQQLMPEYDKVATALKVMQQTLLLFLLYCLIAHFLLVYYT